MGNTTTAGEPPEVEGAPDQQKQPTPFATHLGYDGNHDKADDDLPSNFSVRESRFAMEELQDRDDQIQEATETAESREDESTPPLTDMEDDDDDEDIIPFEVLEDCMLSMTSLETEEMAKGFDLYMQQQHQSECDSEDTMEDDNQNDSSLEMSDMEKGLGDVMQQTPVEPWSIRKWLHCGSTLASASASVDGIQYRNGFEPDLPTLDGIRKELFYARKYW